MSDSIPAGTDTGDSDVYDLIVVGAGPVGENVADRAVRGGLSVVIVERELVGGECSYWACMPSKTLLRAGAARAAAAAVPGVRVDRELDVAAVLRRRNQIVSDWDDAGQVEWLDGASIPLVRGHARLAGERRVVVETSDGMRELRARHAVALCPGSAALLPDIDGLAGAQPWTSREATAAQSVPDSLLVIGGGVVACEMAAAYASFGCEVTVIARSGLLRGWEKFAGEHVEAGLREAGVRLVSGASPTKAGRDEDGTAWVELDGEVLRADELLVATGRSPRTEDLGVDTVGFTPGDWLPVDDSLLVQGTDWLYAVGDVNHRALLTHQGKYQARAAGDVIAARAKGRGVDAGPWGAHAATADHHAVPQVVFTTPEVASVGLTASRARDAGLRVRELDYDLSMLAGASTHASGYRGAARAVVDLDREVLVGATFAGADVADMLQAATIAIVGEVPLSRLWHAVPAYPTLSEIWLRWLEAYGRPGD